jgi:hypothetical protein
MSIASNGSSHAPHAAMPESTGVHRPFFLTGPHSMISPSIKSSQQVSQKPIKENPRQPQHSATLMKKLAILSLAQVAGQMCASAALTDNLIAYYNFEGTGSGGLANKVPGSTAHHGQFIGTPSNGAGPGFAGSTAFEGTNADGDVESTTNRSPLLVGNALNVVKGTSPAANGGQFTISSLGSRGTGAGGVGTEFGSLGKQFAVSVWFYLAPDADNASLSADAQRRFVFESALDGATTAQVFDISWGTTGVNTTYTPYVGQVATTASNVAAGGWHHVVHSFSTEEANTRVTVYVDGVQTATTTAATTAVDFRGINFGANRAGNNRVFDGMLDEIAVWNRSLTPAEVTELHTLGTSGTPVFSGTVDISLSVSPTGGGTVSGSGTYTANTPVSISAIPTPGYLFTEWTGGFAGRTAFFSHTVTTNVSATAVFNQDMNDSDGDGLSNYDEIVVRLTMPNNPDTDGDLIPDGAEVGTTGTNPLTSDIALVNFVRNNLSPNQAGAIALSPLRITRTPGSGAISLALSLSGSADQTNWQDINLSSSPASIVPAGDGWSVTIPAPSSTVNSYILRSSKR